jgi:hypothetical protein
VFQKSKSKKNNKKNVYFLSLEFIDFFKVFSSLKINASIEIRKMKRGGSQNREYSIINICAVRNLSIIQSPSSLNPGLHVVFRSLRKFSLREFVAEFRVKIPDNDTVTEILDVPHHPTLRWESESSPNNDSELILRPISVSSAMQGLWMRLTSFPSESPRKSPVVDLVGPGECVESNTWGPWGTRTLLTEPKVEDLLKKVKCVHLPTEWKKHGFKTYNSTLNFKMSEAIRIQNFKFK